MSRAIDLNGVPDAAPEPKPKRRRHDSMTCIDVTVWGDSNVQFVRGLPDVTKFDGWYETAVAPLKYGDDWQRRQAERARNKAEFGLAVLDEDLPAKYRRKRAKEAK